jgi:hypothetical protein
MNNTILINKYLPFAILYFFFNSFLLPSGLLYTALLAPFFLAWLYKKPAFNYIWYFFIVTVPFSLVHLLHGIEPFTYLKSYLLFFTTYVFCIAFYQFLKDSHTLANIFKSLVIINLFFMAMALIALFIPALKGWFWWENALTAGVEKIARLKLLTYEASYYSLLLVPIVLYYYLRIIMSDFPNKWFTFWMVTIPLVLSLSFGVLAGIAMSLIFLFFSDIRLLTYKPKHTRFILLGLTGCVIALFLLVKFFPDNLVFIRISNVFRGYDSSFKGRVFDALYLGWEVAAQKSIFFGAGPGQLKLIGMSIFEKFYQYNKFQSIAIPNSIGDTLAVFGLVGVSLKIMLEFYFFFKTSVYTNFYRLSLFLFIFIYQFTGSFITNIAEYVIWILAFYVPLFPEFNKINVFKSAGQDRGLATDTGVVNA